MTITDRDREAADRALALGLRMDRESVATLIADTRAQAREEGRREEREAILVLERSYATLWEFAAAIRARGDATHSAADAASED